MNKYGWTVTLLSFALATYIVTLFYLDSLADHADVRWCMEKGRDAELVHNGVSCKR